MSQDWLQNAKYTNGEAGEEADKEATPKYIN